MKTTNQILEVCSQNEFGEVDDRCTDEFDAWLLSVKAETLREAADDWHEPYDQSTYEASDWIAARANTLFPVEATTPIFGPNPADALTIRKEQ